MAYPTSAHRRAPLAALLVVAIAAYAHAADRFVSTAGSDPANDCLASIAPLGGNINADPRLTADLHLRADSPAIDAGTCTGAPATDFDGDTRPAGTTCDIGADEFVP